MARVIIPEMKKIPDGATDADRLQMFNEHKAELVRLNPGHFNPDGTVKTVWQSIKGVFCR